MVGSIQMNIYTVSKRFYVLKVTRLNKNAIKTSESFLLCCLLKIQKKIAVDLCMERSLIVPND